MVSSDSLPRPVAEALRAGLVIPAMPLALNAERMFDERRQRSLIRYYMAAGAGGLADGSSDQLVQAPRLHANGIGNEAGERPLLLHTTLYYEPCRHDQGQHGKQSLLVNQF